MANMRDNSRGTWTGTGTIEHINAGSLQRIADAMEKIAVNYDSLLRERDNAVADRNYWRKETEWARRRVRALRGVITRMKRAKA